MTTPKLYNAPTQEETTLTHCTPEKLRKFGILVCGFCGYPCSDFDTDCGNCRQKITRNLIIRNS